MQRLRLKLAHWLPGRWLVLHGGTVVDVAFVSHHAAIRRRNDYAAVLYLRSRPGMVTVEPAHRPPAR